MPDADFVAAGAISWSVPSRHSRLEYLEELLGTGPLGSALPGIDAIRDAYLQAFLAAKAAAAREAGVTLKIGENTWVSGRLVLPVDVTTVVGNLLDNAIDAARLGSNHTKEVEIELLQDGFDAACHGGRQRRRRRSRLRRGSVHRGQDDKTGLRDTGRPGYRPRVVAADQPLPRWRPPAVQPRQIPDGAATVRRRVHRPAAGRDGRGGAMSDVDLTVLVVDDDFRVANMHAEVVNTLPGFTVTATANTLAAARKAEAVDLALVDVYLPDGSGIDFVRELHGDSMVLTAATEAVTIRAAMAAGALSYVVKPFATTELAARLAGYARYRKILARANLSAGDVDAALDALRPRIAAPAPPTIAGSSTKKLVLDALRTSAAADVGGGGLCGDRDIKGNRPTVSGGTGHLPGGHRRAALRHHWTTRARIRSERQQANPSFAMSSASLVSF